MRRRWNSIRKKVSLTETTLGALDTDGEEFTSIGF